MKAVRKIPHPLIVRTVTEWLVIIATEILHGIVRAVLLGPLVGKTLTMTTAFAKAWNRSVTGSINDLVRFAKYGLGEREPPPYAVGFELSDVLLSALGDGKSRRSQKRLSGIMRSPTCPARRPPLASLAHHLGSSRVDGQACMPPRPTPPRRSERGDTPTVR